MQYQIERIEREFSAGEIADLIGIPQVMQRDWRRHGFLPPPEPGRRARFKLSEAVYLALMKAQTDSGKGPSGAHELAKWSAMMGVVQISLCPLAVQVEGMDLPIEEKRGFMRRMAGVAEGEETTRYLFFPAHASLPKTSLPSGEEESKTTCWHFASLAEMEAKVQRDWITGQIVDLEAFAMSLAIKAGPLITYIATPEES